MGAGRRGGEGGRGRNLVSFPAAPTTGPHSYRLFSLPAASSEEAMFLAPSLPILLHPQALWFPRLSFNTQMEVSIIPNSYILHACKTSTNWMMPILLAAQAVAGPLWTTVGTPLSPWAVVHSGTVLREYFPGSPAPTGTQKVRFFQGKALS